MAQLIQLSFSCLEVSPDLGGNALMARLAQVTVQEANFLQSPVSKQESCQTQKGLGWFPLLWKVLLHIYF